MLPHTHIKLPAWISAANSSLLRQQKRNTVIFIILHVAVSRRQSQNIFGCSLLENLINQLYQLRWEKLGTRSLQYIFFARSSFLLNSKFHSMPPRWSIITDKRNNNQHSKCNKNHGKLAVYCIVYWSHCITPDELPDNSLFFFFTLVAFENCLALGNVGWLQREQCLLDERLFPLCVCVSTIFHDLYLRHGERKNWMHIKLAAFV